MTECPALGEGPDFQHVLDALVSHVAVLDHAGTIVAVNAAWRTFAEANAAPHADPHDRTGIGTSYLDICHQASGPSSEESAAVAAGITAVLRESLPRFELDYPCPGRGGSGSGRARSRWAGRDTVWSSTWTSPRGRCRRRS